MFIKLESGSYQHTPTGIKFEDRDDLLDMMSDTQISLIEFYELEDVLTDFKKETDKC